MTVTTNPSLALVDATVDLHLCDVQNQLDDRRVLIDRVGITDLKYPIVVLDRRQER